MTIKEIAAKHKVSVKTVTKHCGRGRFAFDGIKYLAKDLSLPGALRSKWIISLDDGTGSGGTVAKARQRSGVSSSQQPSVVNLADAKIAVQIQKDKMTIKKIEQQLAEKKIDHFMEFLEMQKNILVTNSVPLKEFIQKNIKKEKGVVEWNQSWSTFIENVYNQLLAALFESL
jgi:hypothetical protein